MADHIPNQIAAMAALEAKARVKDYQYSSKPLAKLDADIGLPTHVCATDMHMIDNNWGLSRYPLVPGHEVVGHVIAVGSDVKDLNVGKCFQATINFWSSISNVARFSTKPTGFFFLKRRPHD